MRTFGSAGGKISRIVNGALFAFACLLPVAALDQPTGAPLVISSIETEQGVPLAILSPDGQTASCLTVRIHWNPQQNVGPDDDATSFTLDIAPDAPGAAIFTAQLWNASLAGALAWQQPWQGARWKILDTPATDGTGIDAALAVGMIATSARRPYPKETLVIGSLRPDGSLGAVPRLDDRLSAAAEAGITRVIIPSVQRFETDGSGQVVNIVEHAKDLHLECVPVDNLVQATEAVMNDPLPAVTLDASTPHYSNEVASHIDDFARREQEEVKSDLEFAPKEADLGRYSARTAALWKSVYADSDAGQQAYQAGQVYAAYRLFARASGRMHGLNALLASNDTTFDLKRELAESDDLRRQIHALVTPPSIDKADLESGLLVSEMADWAYDLNAEIESAGLVARQAFSQRSDATKAETDRARDEIVFANEEVKYLLNQADFFTGLLSRVATNPVPVDENAAHLLPQLIPAQLAAARIFTEGIRPHANELREGLLFDPQLAGYISVLRQTEAAWNARQRRKEYETAPVAAPIDASTKLNAAGTENVGFDPGNTYAPPHTQIASASPAKKLSDAAACLIWVNNDCEIAALDEKYLRLSGAIDSVTHAWRLKDRARLDALLQMAELGARQGIVFAEKADVDTAVLAMIYERAAQLRLRGDDASSLDALRNFWRCALLGNLCWQLAHAVKAQPVDLATGDTKKSAGKTSDKAADKTPDKNTTQAADKTKPGATVPSPGATTNAAPAAVVQTPKPGAAPSTSSPATPPAATDTVIGPPVPPAAPAVAPAAIPVAPAEVPVAPVASGTPAPASTNTDDTAHAPRALPVTDDTAPNPPPPAAPASTNAPPPAAPSGDSAETGGDMSTIPVAPVARTQDYTGGDPSSTNAPPAAAPSTPPPATP